MAQVTRLSAQDASFLYVESNAAFMQDGALCMLDRVTIGTDEILQRLRQRITNASVLRKRLYEVPGKISHPVLVEDPDFDMEAHVRKLPTPTPYDVARACGLLEQLLSVPMNRAKPLWGIWLFDMQDERTGMVIVVHHCILDGMGALHVFQSLLADEGLGPASADSDAGASRAAQPTPLELLRHGLQHRVGARAQAVTQLARLARRSREHPTGRPSEKEASGRRRALLDRIKDMRGLGKGASSPLSAPVGSTRTIEIASLDLGLIKQIKNAHGCTVNDVVLALVTGGLRELLLASGAPSPTWKVRAAVPVNIAPPGTEGEGGNRVSNIFIDMPVDRSDPLDRLRIIAAMPKRSVKVAGFTALMSMAEFAPPLVMRRASRAIARRPQSDLLVSNIRGPAEPMHMFGAKLLECYPCAPLLSTNNISVTVISYADTLFVGMVSDPTCVGDFPRLKAGLLAESERLAKANTR